MDYDSVKSRATEAVSHLSLTEPVTLISIQKHLETQRGRSIVIRPMDGIQDPSLCGLWFGLDDLDLVFHTNAASELHRQQIILHEFSHMVLRHEQEVVPEEYAATLFPDLNPGRVVKALKRTDVHDDIEATAELLADMLANRIFASARRQPKRFGEVFG
ncbi:hypothetical protein [Arthrobacter sp. H14]|uniref:hypothetical protein n=1 Tax=Arthrobacter sp. H14 TaxID=1312959 RepID=UPI00047A0F61|nr:hypothetical protein [Arthrobacter sp. H14]